MTIATTSNDLVVEHGTCIDCAKAHECAEAEQLVQKAPRKLLKHTCGKHRPGHWQDTNARALSLRTLGVLAIRAITQRKKMKEIPMTREERAQELTATNRVELRRLALQKGFPNANSIKAPSETLAQFILDQEFPEAAAAEEPAKKVRTRAPKVEQPAAAAVAATATPGPDAKIDALGQVLNSHGEALDILQARQAGVIKVLHTLFCLIAEPDSADEAFKEAGLEDLVNPPQ